MNLNTRIQRRLHVLILYTVNILNERKYANLASLVNKHLLNRTERNSRLFSLIGQPIEICCSNKFITESGYMCTIVR